MEAVGTGCEVGVEDEAADEDEAGLVAEEVEGVGEVLAEGVEGEVDGHAACEAGDAEQRPEPEGEFRERHGVLVAMEVGVV